MDKTKVNTLLSTSLIQIEKTNEQKEEKQCNESELNTKKIGIKNEQHENESDMNTVIWSEESTISPLHTTPITTTLTTSAVIPTTARTSAMVTAATTIETMIAPSILEETTILIKDNQETQNIETVKTEMLKIETYQNQHFITTNSGRILLGTLCISVLLLVVLILGAFIVPRTTPSYSDPGMNNYIKVNYFFSFKGSNSFILLFQPI